MECPLTNQSLINFLKKTNMISYIRNKIHLYKLRRFMKRQNEHFEKIKKAKEDFDKFINIHLNSFKNK